MMGGDVPDPFADSAKQLIEELHAQIASQKAVIESCRECGMSIVPRGDGNGFAINNVEARKMELHIELCRKTMETLKKRVEFINHAGLPFNQRLAFEEMVDAIDSTLARVP